MKKELLIAAMTCSGISCSAETHTEQFTLHHTYQIDHECTIPLHVSQGQYLRGIIQSHGTLEGAVLLDPSHQVAKYLISPGQKESEVFWRVEQTGDYQLKITSSQPSNQVEVELHALPLKPDQSVDPKEKIISPLLIKTASKLHAHRPDAEKNFWHEVKQQGTPLIEPLKDGQAILTFLWQGDAHNVRVLGAPYDGHAYLSRIKETAIWYKSYIIPDGTRFSYRLAPNVPQILDHTGFEQRRAVLATTQPDPLNFNPYFATDDLKFGKASTLTYGHVSNDDDTKAMSHPAGHLTTYTLFSHQLNNSRKVVVYEPNATYAISADAPLLIVFDGDDYLSKVPTPIILDNLIAARKIPPVRAVFLNSPAPSQRGVELPPNPKFAAFMATEFLPWLRQTLNITPSGRHTLLSGSSYGGLASLYIATQYPHDFGKVLSQSGSFWWGPDKNQPEWLTHQIKRLPHQPIEIYMNAGLFETKPESANILQTNRALYQTLKNKGYSVAFEEIAGGHDYFSWRAALATGLITLLSMK